MLLVQFCISAVISPNMIDLLLVPVWYVVLKAAMVVHVVNHVLLCASTIIIMYVSPRMIMTKLRL